MKRAKIYRGAILVFIIGFLCSLALSLKSFASANIFKIKNVELTELSATAEGNIWSFDEATIASDVTFHKLNDTARYTITFQNTDTVEHTIRAITDNNSSPFVTFYYDNHANKVIGAGEEFTLIVTVKYENEIAVATQRLQADMTKFFISIVNVEDFDEFFVVPDTGANTVFANGGAIESNVILIVSALGLVIAGVVYVKKHKKAAGMIVVLVAVVSFVTIATTVRALTFGGEEFTIATRFSIIDRFMLTWVDASGNEHKETVLYGEAPNTINTGKDGYNLVGWIDENGDPFDKTQVMTADTKIFPVFEPITYTVQIDTDGDGDADITTTVNYEESINLPNNNNDKPGHHPNGWTDGNGHHYDDGDDISGLITEDGGTITIIPDFAPNQYTVNLDTDGDGNADTSLNVTYGEEVNLPENQAEKPGHHPNGWTDGNGHHYDDGDDISGLLLDDGSVVTLMPDFAPNVFTVGLDYDGDGEDDTTLTVTYGQEALLPEAPDPEAGSRKNGWIDGEGNTYAEDEDISDLLLGNGESMSLKPNYLPIEYAIAIDTDNDGVADIVETVSYGESFTLPTNTATQPGYLPNGWVNGRTHYDNGDSVQNLTTVDGSTIEIAPDFVPRTMNICYTTTSDPTTVGEDKCETATFNRAYYMSENYYTRTGYDAASSWSLSDGGEKAYDADEEYYPNDDIIACGDNLNCTKTLYAMWDPHQTTISYAPGDSVTDATGTVANSTFTYDQQATFTSDTFFRPGYTQSGWKLNGTDYNLGGVISKWTVDEPSQTAKATWTPEVYNIAFNMNCRPNITGTGSMDNMTNITYDAGATLTPNEFSCGEGYSFAGWKRDNTGSLITNGGRADKFDVDANGDTVQLYAQWNIDDYFVAGMREAGKTKMTANDGKDYYKMQDMTTALCSFVPTATTNDNNKEIQLVDTRDGKIYWVSKLKDGKCWMTQNLDYDLDTTKTLTPNDTNITANWTPTTNIIPASQIETWRVINNRADSLNPGDWYYQEGSSVPTVHNYLTNGANANFSTTPFAANGTHTHIGNFYNFQAFTAIHDSTSLQNGTSSTSICPKGWTLPSDYLGLLSAYGAISVNGSTVTTINEKALTTKPLYFVRGGVILGTTDGIEPGQLGDPGVSFMYPTNIYNYTPKIGNFGMEMIQDTVLRVYNPATLENPTGNNIFQTRYGRGAGITVRCVAR